MTEILEINKESTYRVGGLEIPGSELIHKVADGYRYDELREHLKGGVINE